MRVNNGRVGVLLKGGLGNQLFQIAAGIYSSDNQPLHLFSKFTLPRETNGQADLFYFKLPPEVTKKSDKSTKFERRVLDLNLRLAIKQTGRFKNDLLRAMVNFITGFLFSMRFKTYTKINSGVGTGFCDIKLGPKLTLLNGYFQAHQYAFDIKTYKKMQSIQIINPSKHLNDWIDIANLEKPIIVHLRLTDYKLEKGIGILSSRYYEKALKQIVQATPSRNIWVFSDEPKEVNLYIKPPSFCRIRVIEDNRLNPAETLELMRHGSAYVIANSTFSWWAAFLSYERGCPTIMPSPWFQKMPSPKGIKPKNWMEIEYLE